MAKSTYMKVKSKGARLAVLAALFVASTAQAADALTIDVHRDANCGCCKKWISHLEANGFQVIDHVEHDMTSVKQRLEIGREHVRTPVTNAHLVCQLLLEK